MADPTKVCPYCAETIRLAAIKCRYCQSDLASGSDLPVAASDTPSAGPVPTPVRSEDCCPKCGQNDHVARISGLVDSSDSATSGAAVTTTVGYVDGPAYTRSNTSVDLQTRTRLSRKFDPPAAPTRPWGLAAAVGAVVALLVGWLQAAVVALASIGVAEDAVWPMIAPLGVGAAVGYAVFAFLGQSDFNALDAEWHNSLRRVRAGYYCRRDDLAFSPSAPSGLEPPMFVRECFRDFERQRDRMAAKPVMERLQDVLHDLRPV
jgi:hypothetical protein